MKLFERKFRLELPGHIRSALSNIHVLRKEIDLIINVIDSRSPKISNVYEDLFDVFSEIPILNIASKPDLSNVVCENAFDFRNSKNRPQIFNLIKEALHEKDSMYKKRGYISHFQILVIGLPNVGKSTLINLLRNKKIAVSENRPGVTKKVVKHHIGDNLWLYDSPGVFLHDKADEITINKLFLINAVPTQLSDYSGILEWAYSYLKQHYKKDLLSLIGGIETKNYREFIEFLAVRFNFKFKDDVLDLDRSENKFLGFIRNGSIKIFWDLDVENR